jgi:hypothetical protein
MSDYGTVTEPQTVRFERILPGPIERVWEYLTDSEKRGMWLASGKMEPRVGAEFELRFDHESLSPNTAQPPPRSSRSTSEASPAIIASPATSRRVFSAPLGAMKKIRRRLASNSRRRAIRYVSSSSVVASPIAQK